MKEKRPAYSLIENVKNLTSKKFKPQFEQMLEDLEQLGYNNYFPNHNNSHTLNARDYGIPQNRERVFILSIRKDIDRFSNSIRGFDWPKPFDNGLRLKELLEEVVDERYYISEDKCTKLITSMNQYGNTGDFPTKHYTGAYNPASREFKTTGWNDNMPALCARDYKDPKVVAIPCSTPDRAEKQQNGRRFKDDGDPMFTITTQDVHGVVIIDNLYEDRKPREFEDCPTLRAGRQGLLVKTNNVKGYEIAEPGDTINFENLASTTRRGRVGKGVAQTINTMTSQAVVEMANEIQVIEIPQTVTVRKHAVDIEKLKIILREAKEKSGLSYKSIAASLNKALTLVEHWFRLDIYFSIPDADIWDDLKKLLNISTDEFDLSVKEFEEKEGVFEKANRIYGIEGIAPTITSASADEKILVSSPNECKMIGHIDVGGHDICKRVYSSEGISPTIPTMSGGNIEPKTLINYRIRKLTPRECWRLMGFDDADFDKAAEVCSSSQLYKQAGNSIVVNVLEEIYRILFELEGGAYEISDSYQYSW